ncbi:hypothetical protein QBC39DRAFT_346218 [Podospora conica]|nr:hypothetical protein QBC39DRAFT_346218 [Schizothecium conicum]
MMTKQGLVAILGLSFGSQLVAAGCCRSNQCLKAIVSAKTGIEDCAALLAVTVTGTAVTLTETSTIVPTEYNTIVDTASITQTDTTTASTETLLFTTSTTTTASTETDRTTTTEIVTVTSTDFQTVTTTVGPPVVSLAPLKARADLELPVYAAGVCPSLKKYIAACKCAGVTPVTVTQGVPATTVTVQVTTPVTSAVLTTFSTTETEVASVTSTVSTTVVETISVTVTSAVTETDQVSTTTTIPETTTTTVTSAVASCTIPTVPFKATATEYNNTPLLMYANLMTGLTGGLTWQPASASTAASVQNKFIWALDSQGYLNLAYNVPPYTYKYYAYMSTSSSGSNWPQVNTEASVRASVNAGAATMIKGCVDSITGELHLDAAGRKNILWCGNQLWMSYGLGEDINRGTCNLMKPIIAPQ